MTPTEETVNETAELTDIGIFEDGGERYASSRACLIDETTDPETVFGPIITSLANKSAHDVATAFLETFEENNEDPRDFTSIALAKRYEDFFEELEDEVAGVGEDE